MPQPTARVVATGLTKRADLNGCEAIVLSWHVDRWAVRFTLTGECVRIREANLTPAAQLLDVLGADGLFSCLLRFSPDEILLVRLLGRVYCDHGSAAMRSAAWQALHLPVPALCQARAWQGALARCPWPP